LENIKEMDKFLDSYDHPKMNQEDISHLNRSITLNEIGTAIMPILLKLFHELERDGTLPKSFYETSITLIPKLDKDTSKKRSIYQFP
jgi:hypothetical protein